MSHKATDADRLERFRGYLHLLARMHAPARLQAQVDASDVVQETLVQALAGLEGFRGQSDAELAAWLRQILARQLARVSRDLTRQKRDVTRQRSLEAELEQSTSRLQAVLADGTSSPSQKAQRNEQLLRVADAILALPDAQREALTLYHVQQRPLDEIAQQMGRTTDAVAGLVKRALHTLRERL